MPDQITRCPHCNQEVQNPIEAESRLLFVYGTLKRGCHNHRLLLNSRYRGEAKLAPNFVLMGESIPFLCPVEPGTGLRVEGEIYEVTPCQLHRLDSFEGHPHHYRRELVPLAAPIEVNGQKVEQAETYVMYHIERYHVTERRYAKYSLSLHEPLARENVDGYPWAADIE